MFSTRSFLPEFPENGETQQSFDQGCFLLLWFLWQIKVLSEPPHLLILQLFQDFPGLWFFPVRINMLKSLHS